MTHVGVTGPIDAQVHQRLVAELWRRDRRARRQARASVRWHLGINPVPIVDPGLI